MSEEKPRYNLFLLSPRQKYINYPAHSEMAKMFGKKRLMVPLALPTIASLTPENYKIFIYDEEIEEIPTAVRPDIVGITTLAATAGRAFELGDHYRSLGAKVIYGGPYASFLIEEALKHGDSVVVGEAEGKWEKCLADFEKGEIKQVYESSALTEYHRQKPPRWDLVSMKKIFQVAVQVSRGCPFNCDFCLVSRIFGRKMRYREIDNVVEEIMAAPSKYFFFVDDNLTINKRYAKELMKAIKPLNISWGCMCSLDVATDDELLRLMADAGCFNILVGFESLNPGSLDETQKHHNRGGFRQKAEALFSNGAFTRPGGDISIWMKARLSWITFKEFILTSDKDRRALFSFIFKLIRSKQIAIDKGLGFLLSMLGYHRHVRLHHLRMDEYRRLVMSQDTGKWKQQI
ncbi:MAG: radical SAM protein [Bacteroidetes bacterium]|nr:radical SAM protein [Bacteroidota bacterium]